MAKRQVLIQVVVNKMGDVNTIRETFDAELIIRSRWTEDGGGSWNPNLFIENVIGDPPSKTTTWNETNEGGATVVVEQKRLRGSFSKPMELEQFPFDVQELWLMIKADQPIAETELIEDPTHLHKVHVRSFIDSQEFYLYKYMATFYPHRNRDPELPRPHRPSIKVSCYVARRPQFFVWNLIFLMFLLSCMSFLSFTMDVDKLLNVRLQLMFTLVLATIMFRGVVNAHIPKIAYLTLIDKFMLVSIVLIILLSFWHGISSRLDTTFRRAHDFIVAIVYACIYVLFLVIFIIATVAGNEAKARRGK